MDGERRKKGDLTCSGPKQWMARAKRLGQRFVARGRFRPVYFFTIHRTIYVHFEWVELLARGRAKDGTRSMTISGHVLVVPQRKER